jgi:NADPH:quinone reductase-like Zn-dependent oxidoreductase
MWCWILWVVILDSDPGRARVRPGGTLISLKKIPQKEIAAHPDVQGQYVLAKPDGVQLTQIVKLVDDGYVKPHIDAVFHLSEAQKAHELGEQGHTCGKIVLKMIV